MKKNKITVIAVTASLKKGKCAPTVVVDGKRVLHSRTQVIRRLWRAGADDPASGFGTRWQVHLDGPWHGA